MGVQQLTSGPVPPQLEAVTASTDVVTLSLGANDENLFGTLFTACMQGGQQDPQGSPCRVPMHPFGTEQRAVADLVVDLLDD